MRRILNLIGFLLLLLGVSGRAVPLATPEGRQCPTAKVHTIRVAVKSACGCVIGHVERAPKPGEEGFVQCRCNEKRTDLQSSAPPMPAVLTAVLRVDLPILLTSFEEPGYLLPTAEWSTPPSPRPPASA